jgi:hypothetical protein
MGSTLLECCMSVTNRLLHDLYSYNLPTLYFINEMLFILLATAEEHSPMHLWCLCGGLRQDF